MIFRPSSGWSSFVRMLPHLPRIKNIMKKIDTSFEKLLVLLVNNGVKFTTVGGIAVCLNGYVRLTDKFDVGVLQSILDQSVSE